MIGDYLVIRTAFGYKKIILPFLNESGDGDFFFFKPLDNSVLPNPFTSISDFLPKNKQEGLNEFAIYPGFFSSLMVAAVLPEVGRIT